MICVGPGDGWDVFCFADRRIPVKCQIASHEMYIAASSPTKTDALLGMEFHQVLRIPRIAMGQEKKGLDIRIILGPR